MALEIRQEEIYSILLQELRSLDLYNTASETVVVLEVGGNIADISEGDIAQRTMSLVSAPIGDTILGRVITSLGDPIIAVDPILNQKG